MPQIDYDRLRKDLIDYYGTGMMMNPMMMMELAKIETCSNEELLQIAINNNIYIDDYIINIKIRL